MKRKWLAVGLCMAASLTMFTGCVNTESLSEELVVQGTNKEHIAYELEDWKKLIREVEPLNDYNDQDSIWTNDRSYDAIGNSTYVGEDGSSIWIKNIEGNQGKKAFKFVDAYLGKELEGIIEEARNLKVDEEATSKIIDGTGSMITRPIGENSVIVTNTKGCIGLYVMHEPFTLKQKVDQDFVNEFKTDNFLLKAFSAGKEESIIEITTPSFMLRNYDSNLYNSTSYYQLFRNANNELIKTRMIINTYKENGIYKEEFVPLEKVIAHLNGDESLNTDIQNEVSQIIEGKSEGKVLKNGNLKCTIKKHDGPINQEKLIEIVIK